MTPLDDDIIDGFTEETKAILKEAETMSDDLVSATEDTVQKKLLSELAIRFDRVMGAANTIATMDASYMILKKIGEVAGLCKLIGYKTIEKNAQNVVPIVAAFYMDAIEIIYELVNCIKKDPKENSESQKLLQSLQKRLEIVAAQLK